MAWPSWETRKARPGALGAIDVLALDRNVRRDTQRLRERWAKARNAEKSFGRTLRALARRCGELTRGMLDPEDPASAIKLRAMLDRYAEAVHPWAAEQARRMVLEVTRRDEAVWAALGRESGRALRQEIRGAETGEMVRRRINEVTELITSLPREAAQRVQTFALQGIEGAKRASEVVELIMATGEVSKSRANLIARTEVGRTSSLLVQARAEHVGSTHYIWRSVGDLDVRKLHKRLNGKTFAWDDPPVSGSNGERAHAGQIYNCRCYAEPIIPDEEE